MAEIIRPTPEIKEAKLAIELATAKLKTAEQLLKETEPLLFGARAALIEVEEAEVDDRK